MQIWVDDFHERTMNMIDLDQQKDLMTMRIQQRHPQLLSSQNLGCQTKQILSQSQGPRIAAADGFLVRSRGMVKSSLTAWRESVATMSKWDPVHPCTGSRHSKTSTKVRNLFDLFCQRTSRHLLQFGTDFDCCHYLIWGLWQSDMRGYARYRDRFDSFSLHIM